jgi:hypothetical protein
VTTSDHEQLEQLLDRWEEARRANRPLSAEELCAHSPRLREGLEKRIRVLEWVLKMEARPPGESVAVSQLETALPPGEQPAGGPAPPLNAGDAFDEMALVRLIGRGGMGEVWEAVEPRLNRRVAVKFLRAELAFDPTAVRRFAREAMAYAAVQHENVLAVHTVGAFRDRPYLVMPLLEGESLAARLLREPKLPFAEAVRVGRAVAAGLAAVHARGLVHRDVKPGNIWLAADGAVKLLDLGLARTRDGLLDGQPVSRAGALVGTPEYMAPEQADGREVDGRSDLFSLGVVLYQTATGTNPFAAGGVMAVLSALANLVPPPPSGAAADVPAAFDELAGGLLAKRPEDRRPCTAAEVSDRLAAIASGDPRAAHLVTRRPRRRWAWLPAAAAVVVLAAGLTWAGLAYFTPATVVVTPPTPDERVREVAGKLTEQPVRAFFVDETMNGIIKNRRRNEHTFEGITGEAVYGRVRDGAVGVKVPYSGRYKRKSTDLFGPVTELQTVSGVISLVLVVDADGMRLADYAHTETGGDVTDRGHNAQKSAREAVLALVRDAVPQE